jgi:hypothetical protein
LDKLNTQLNKTHAFVQIENPLDQDIGQNAITTGACRELKERGE